MGLLQTLAKMSPRLEPLLTTGLIEQTKRRETNRQVLLADCGCKLIHQLENKLAALFWGSTVAISALVDVGAEKLFGKIAVAAVDLHSVEANFHCCLGGVAIVLDRLLDMLDRHLDWRVIGVWDGLGGSHRGMREALGR